MELVSEVVTEEVVEMVVKIGTSSSDSYRSIGLVLEVTLERKVIISSSEE